MTLLDYQLEKFYKASAARPKRKFEETETSFNRDIFWYDRSELSRQADKTDDNKRVTYEDHRKAVETAVNIMQAKSQHEIAMAILTHRFFAQYRADVFAGEGSFYTDYAFVLKKIATLFNHTHGKIRTANIPLALKEFKEPTLVQINHAAGTVTKVKVPESEFTLNEWAIKFNQNAPESTSYRAINLDTQLVDVLGNKLPQIRSAKSFK